MHLREKIHKNVFFFEEKFPPAEIIHFIYCKYNTQCLKWKVMMMKWVKWVVPVFNFYRIYWEQKNHFFSVKICHFIIFFYVPYTHSLFLLLFASNKKNLQLIFFFFDTIYYRCKVFLLLACTVPLFFFLFFVVLIIIMQFLQKIFEFAKKFTNTHTHTS